MTLSQQMQGHFTEFTQKCCTAYTAIYYQSAGTAPEFQYMSIMVLCRNVSSEAATLVCGGKLFMCRCGIVRMLQSFTSHLRDSVLNWQWAKQESHVARCRHMRSLCRPVGRSTRRSTQESRSSLPSFPRSALRSGRCVWLVLVNYLSQITLVWHCSISCVCKNNRAVNLVIKII